MSILLVDITYVGGHGAQDLGFRASAMARPSIRQANKRGTSSRKRRQQLLPWIPVEITLHETSANLPCTSSRKRLRSSVVSKQLLPGIPDEITLYEISPKLPWKIFYILSAVSRAWGRAIRSRKVYDARVLSHSTETFVIVHLNFDHDRIALWSTRENSLIKLPEIRHRSEHLVSLDGRIYLLGNGKIGDRCQDPFILSKDVFVLDVAAVERHWRKCARMNEKRSHFEGAVIDGKICVCGGVTIERGTIKFCGSEVYNPKKDLWSPIKPMARYFHRTQAVGSELFVHRRERKSGNRSSYLNVYHPGKDEWRVVSPFGSGRDHLRRGHVLFVARGKLHSLDNSGIDFYNEEENSWTELHSFSFIDRDYPLWLADDRSTVVHVDDELVIKYSVPDWVETGRSPHSPCEEKAFLAKSNGFGGENKEIVWQKASLANPLESTRELSSILL